MKLTALALIVGLMAASSGGVLAQNRHLVCEARQHDCGDAARISSCCCDDVSAGDDASTPAARVEMASGVVATAVLFEFEHVIETAAPPTAVQISPPRLCLLDLPILFATLLI